MKVDFDVTADDEICMCYVLPSIMVWTEQHATIIAFNWLYFVIDITF